MGFRKDAELVKEARMLFYKYHYRRFEVGASEEDEENARLVLHFVQEYIGNSRFQTFVRTLVHEDSQWAMDIALVHYISDEDGDCEMSLSLMRAAISALKTRQISVEDGAERSKIEGEIHEWALMLDDLLQDMDPCAGGRHAKAMLDDHIASKGLNGDKARLWGDKWLQRYESFLSRSPVLSADEGELANGLLDIVKQLPLPLLPIVQAWVDRCFHLYEVWGMPVYGSQFARGMLNILTPYQSDGGTQVQKWKERFSSEQQRQTRWRSGGQFGQDMLRAIFRDENIHKSQSFVGPLKRRLEKVTPDSTDPAPRLVKTHFFPLRIPSGLLDDVDAQTHILDTAIYDAEGKDAASMSYHDMFERFRDAIELWTTGESSTKIGNYHDRTSEFYSAVFEIENIVLIGCVIVEYAVRYRGVEPPVLRADNVELWRKFTTLAALTEKPWLTRTASTVNVGLDNNFGSTILIPERINLLL